MSVKALTCAMALRDVSPSEKLLLLALANYADEHMRCYPSQRRLAEDTCLSARTIRSLLSALEGRRMLSRQERQRGDGSRASDIVTLHFAGLVPASPDAGIAGGAEIISGGVGKPLPGGAEMVSGLTTFEPSDQPSKEPLEGAKRARPIRSRRVPADWRPSQTDLEIGQAEGFSPGEIERELAKFRDHEYRDPHSDWSACFRNWLRKGAAMNPRKAHDRPDRPSQPTAREDSLRAHHAGAMAALNRRIGSVG